MRLWRGQLAVVAICALALGACSGSKGEHVACSDVSQCHGPSQVCVGGYCADSQSARVGASAAAVGADVPVSILDADGNACEADRCATLPYGTQVTFQASDAPPGFRFAGWSGSPECTGATLQLVIPILTDNTHCVATYVRRLQVSGAVTGVATGGVSASSDDPLATCMDGRCEVDPETPVHLVAAERWGESFLGWSGAGCGDAKTLEIVVTPHDRDVQCTAAFVRRIVVSGQAMNADATIAVTSNATGAVCEPGSCVVDSGGDAKLNAPAIDGYRFAGWSGTELCSGSEPVLAFSMLTAPQQCLATYARRYTVSGSSMGATPPPPVVAWSTDLNANCQGASCQVDQGGSVTLLASSASGFRLDRWSGPQCDGQTGAAVELSEVAADLACVANYTQGIAVIGAVVGAPGEVVASSTSAGALCTAGRCDISAGGDVTLTAPELDGYRFTNWDGDPGCASQSATIQFTQVTESRTCYARYAPRFLVRGVASPGEGGSVAASSASAGALCSGASCTLDSGGEVVLEATPLAGYRFAGWSGGAACTGSATTVHVSNVAANVTCQANFVGRVTVAGVAAPAGSGSVDASSDSGASMCGAGSCAVDQGSRVGLTAVPATGFQFVSWSGCSTSTDLVLTLDGVRRDVMCQANFAPIRYTVSSSVAPASAGSVTAASSSSGASCQGGGCTVNFGGAVNLTADAAPGFQFTGWSGCANSQRAVLTVPNVRANANCQANFVRLRYTVTATVGSGQGTVTTSCKAPSCTVEAGANVTVSATAGSGFTFAGWSGCSMANTPDITFAPTGSVTCTANFSAVRWTVAVEVGSGQGTVTCGNGASPCTVSQGQSVTLLAKPSANFMFARWSGCSNDTSPSITLSPSANVTCTANFTAVVWKVTAAATRGQGTATCGNNSATTCSVNAGQSVMVSATASDNFMFASWSCSDSKQTSITISPTNDVTCTAMFTPITHTVKMEVSGSGAATCGNGQSTCTVNAGTSVTLDAVPADGFDFTGWSGCSNSMARSTSISPTSDLVCTANFAPSVWKVTTTIGSGQGKASCGGSDATSCSVAQGQSVTVTATDVDGFTFMNWSGCSDATTRSIPITPKGNVTCIANFAPILKMLVVTGAVDAKGGGQVTASTSAGSCAGAKCTVASGVSVTLTATRDSEATTFTRWSCTNGETPSDNPLTIQATQDVTCTASFGAASDGGAPGGTSTP